MPFEVVIWLWNVIITSCIHSSRSRTFDKKAVWLLLQYWKAWHCAFNEEQSEWWNARIISFYMPQLLSFAKSTLVCLWKLRYASVDDYRNAQVLVIKLKSLLNEFIEYRPKPPFCPGLVKDCFNLLHWPAFFTSASVAQYYLLKGISFSFQKHTTQANIPKRLQRGKLHQWIKLTKSIGFACSLPDKHGASHVCF